MIRFFIIPLTLSCLLFAGEVMAVDFFQEEQTARADSLRKVLEQEAVPDSLRMDALIHLGRELRTFNPTTALEHTQEALVIAETLNYPAITGRVLTDIGHLYWRLGEFNTAYDYLLEARSIFRRENIPEGYARTLNHFGVLLSGRGYYDKGLEHYYQALNIYEDLNLLSRQAIVMNNIGMTYQLQDDLDLAEEYHMRSLAISKEANNERGMAYSLNNLASLSFVRGNHEEAQAYFEAALEIRQRYPDFRALAETRREIGIFYSETADHKKALEELYLARGLYDRISDDHNLARVDNILGDVYTARGQLLQAEHYFNQSLAAAERIGLPSTISKNYLGLSKLMAMRDDYTNAYNYQEKYLAIQDSIYDAKSKRRALELKMLYDRKRKESEIALLRKTKQINELNLEKQRLFQNLLLLIILIILILLVLIYYRYVEVRRTNRMLEAQKEEITRKNQQLHDLNNKLLRQKKELDELNKNLKKSERHLISVNKTKDRFFSIISHDLRNPFASIVSFSRILKRDINTLTKEELQELTVELDKSVLKINSLLENLLQWSQTQTGKIKYKPELFVVKDLIRDNVNLLSIRAREKSIDITDKVVDHLVVWGDVNMTNTIIRNLLSNALKYSYPGGRVTLNSRKLNAMVEISIADDGTGIPEEDQEKLFRVDSLYTTLGTNDEKGSGLGLLLCKEFVKKQGGDIAFESTKGKGSVFSFTIPLKPPKQ